MWLFAIQPFLLFIYKLHFKIKDLVLQTYVCMQIIAIN